jgi:segregation and condensation protein B
MPTDDPELRSDEEPLDAGDLDLALGPAPEEESAEDPERRSREKG